MNSAVALLFTVLVASAMAGNLLRAGPVVYGAGPVAFAAGPAVVAAPVAYSAYAPAAVVKTHAYHAAPVVRTVAYASPVYGHAAPVLVH